MADTKSVKQGQTKPAAPETTPNAAPALAPAEPVDALPGKLYERTPNPRLDDVKRLVAQPTRVADGKTVAQWYRIVTGTEKDAQTAAQHVRRASRELDIKLAVKLPATEKGSVYFAARLDDAGNVQRFSDSQ